MAHGNFYSGTKSLGVAKNPLPHSSMGEFQKNHVKGFISDGKLSFWKSFGACGIFTVVLSFMVTFVV